MSTRSLSPNVSAAYTLTPATRTADASGAAVDLRSFESVAVYLQIGVGGITFDATNKLEFLLEHSDDDQSYVGVTQDEIQGVTLAGSGGMIRSLTAAHAAASFTEVGYIGGKRYLRVRADFSGTHGTGTPIAALVVRSHPTYRPIA